MRHLIARLKQTPCPTSEATAAELSAPSGITVNSQPSGDDTSEVWDFLQPPQGADELGRSGLPGESDQG